MKKSLLIMAMVGLILWFPLLAQAGDGKVPGKPFEVLQQQLDDLYDRIEAIESFIYRGNRFTDMGDGTIRDNETGLIWLKDASCSAFGNSTWGAAKAAASMLADDVCGLTDGSSAGDWRLPTKAEWEAFYSLDWRLPVLVNTVGDGQWSEGDAFIGVLFDLYWSSTEASPGATAWAVAMGSGKWGRHYQVFDAYVWPVRSGN